ncbi:hypothetical protein FPZ43_15310 [Mucilaginibacter pallidiroseus]|uniref:Uncharacterized protein n=1 Tax=Mucilaginibacter pallidiroseus TaxID=2599295 RepID=A0A563U588_9SPHI|nr:hypothetical protein [Mucilaginibacter pallidiroseus]TWR26520.1 hypothetical protein FPZ43_15310 [Mucilaginibacter pallidiroseus]
MKKAALNKPVGTTSVFIALLLALVFVFITTVQAFHKHSYTSLKDDLGDTEYVYSAEKCSICDYVLHKQSHYANLAYAPVINAPLTKAVTLLSRSYAGIYKFTLQGFTNKGPPVAAL